MKKFLLGLIVALTCGLSAHAVDYLYAVGSGTVNGQNLSQGDPSTSTNVAIAGSNNVFEFDVENIGWIKFSDGNYNGWSDFNNNGICVQDKGPYTVQISELGKELPPIWYGWSDNINPPTSTGKYHYKITLTSKGTNTSRVIVSAYEEIKFEIPTAFYVIGNINSWNTSNPQQMTAGEKGVFTSTVTLPDSGDGFSYFSFCTQSASTEGDWAGIGTRFGAVNNNFTPSVFTSPQELTISENAFKLEAGTYDLKVVINSIDDMTVLITPHKELNTYTVYFDNSKAKWENVYAYAWTSDGPVYSGMGLKLEATKDNPDLYQWDIQSEEEPVFEGILFNNGNWQGDNQTENFTYEVGKTYTFAPNEPDDPQDWYYNLTGTYNNWETNDGKQPKSTTDGILEWNNICFYSVASGANPEEIGQFEFKVWNGLSDVYYSAGAGVQVPLYSWTQLNEEGGHMTINNDNATRTYNVKINTIDKTIYIEPTELDDLYLMNNFSNDENWEADPSFKFTNEGDGQYSLTIGEVNADGEFKVATADWFVEFATLDEETIDNNGEVEVSTLGGSDMKLSQTLLNVTFSLDINEGILSVSGTPVPTEGVVLTLGNDQTMQSGTVDNKGGNIKAISANEDGVVAVFVYAPAGSTVYYREKPEEPELRVVKRASAPAEWTAAKTNSALTGLDTPYITLSGDGTVQVKYNSNGVDSDPVDYDYAVTPADDTNIPNGIEEVIAAEDGEAVYYNLQGVRVANPKNGIYVKVVNGKAVKVVK